MVFSTIIPWLSYLKQLSKAMAFVPESVVKSHGSRTWKSVQNIDFIPGSVVKTMVFLPGSVVKSLAFRTWKSVQNIDFLP